MNLRGKRLLLYTITGIVLIAGGCVSIKLRTANSYYEDYAFADAIKNYEAVLSKKMIPDAMIKLADCYRQTNNSAKAEVWYKQVVTLSESLPVHKYYYAKALMENGKYAEAKVWFGKYLEIASNDDKAKKLMESCDSISEYFADTTQYNISLLPLNNSGTNNFSPTYYRSGIVFLSDRPAQGKKRMRSEYTGKEYLDLFYAKKTEKGNWLEPELLRGNINGLYNEGPAVFTKEYNGIYFTRNDYSGSTVKKNKKNFNVLKIYKGSFSEGEWNITSELAFNNDEYSTAHPALSTDSSTLYFVSDMPWGYGGTDIYLSRLVNGRWSNPVNLGAKVNTAGNELFPFIQNDTILYFASDGNYGLGGLDIYQCIFNGENWSEAFNVGYPVNSSKDDFGFIIDSPGKNGYFSSNRYGGADKIFTFKKNPPKLNFNGIVTDKITSAPLNKIRITFISENFADTSIVTSIDGKFNIQLEPERIYNIMVTKNNYYTFNSNISTKGQYRSKTFDVSYKLEKIILGKTFINYNITFDKNDWKIKPAAGAPLDSIMNWMKENPGLQVEISCHTDSRGNDKDNLLLTQKRAEAVADYLSLHGIAPRRITVKGYGETRLLNGCVNGILCLEEDHRINKRIEIKITGIE